MRIMVNAYTILVQKPEEKDCSEYTKIKINWISGKLGLGLLAGLNWLKMGTDGRIF
jgi:hypothetical protein